MKVPLNQISDIQFGLHAQPTGDGDVAYLTAKHFSKSGNITEKIESRIKVTKKVHGHLLQDGDVIFAGKGFRNFAWCYREQFGAAIASSLFYVIRPRQEEIYPEYLCALLNLPKNRSYFQLLGAGVTIPSIRKSELGDFKVSLIKMETQKQVAAIQELHQKEIDLIIELTDQKINLHQSIISKIIN